MAKPAKKNDKAAASPSKGTASRSTASAAPGATGPSELLGLPLVGFVASGLARAKGAGGGPSAGPAGRVLVVGQSVAAVEKVLAKSGLAPWQLERLARKRGELLTATTAEGPLWVVAPAPRKAGKSAHGGLLETSGYAAMRDLAAPITTPIADLGLARVTVELHGVDEDEQRGFFAGLELGHYRFRNARYGKGVPAPALLGLDDEEIALAEEAALVAQAVNVARHLVNLPGGDLGPSAFARLLTTLFKGSKTMAVEVLAGERLARERMGLLRAVGGAAADAPCLVHLRYRPSGASRLAKPLAFVGKGITFDSGGLDIKDAASMRLMKKDMGGAASLVGLAYHCERSAVDVACDFYLAVAENAVGSGAMRPGDVLVSRAGLTVEIDNTDAEGRLVLADALDYAVKADGKNAPLAVVNLATLTGAMRVALGVRLGGLFANDDALADALQAAAQRHGDPLWRMPLVGEYFAQLKSNVADFANSGPSRFGGAITAALFLARFVGEARWAHVDMYAWTEAGAGGCLETGGNGQCVQLLAAFLRSFAA
jgi:leucyl aminopeptidase